MRVDEAYLLDALLAARRARRFASGLTFEQSVTSELHQSAVMKAIETVGEAASRVSQQAVATHPEIPWAEMIGMRHRLVHGYFEVDLKRVWDTVQGDLPPLIAALEALLPPEDE